MENELKLKRRTEGERKAYMQGFKAGQSARPPSVSEEELVSIIEKCRWGTFAEHVKDKPDMMAYPKKLAQAILAHLGLGKATEPEKEPIWPEEEKCTCNYLTCECDYLSYNRGRADAIAAWKASREGK